MVGEQCVLSGATGRDWLADEEVTLQLAVLDKKTKTYLLPLMKPGVRGSLSVSDVRVRVEEMKEQKADASADVTDVATVAVQAVANPLKHQFEIKVKVAKAGEYRLRVWVRDVLVAKCPLMLEVKRPKVFFSSCIFFFPTSLVTSLVPTYYGLHRSPVSSVSCLAYQPVRSSTLTKVSP
jgi:phosphoribosylformylglycinamidine (FGAM) synthase PurS component